MPMPTVGKYSHIKTFLKKLLFSVIYVNNSSFDLPYLFEEGEEEEGPRLLFCGNFLTGYMNVQNYHDGWGGRG